MIEKVLGYTLVTVITILVTFFGIGPVILADGPMDERLMMLAVVILIYIIIGILFRLWLKRQRHKRR